MLKNTQVNWNVTKKIANALGNLNQRVVYVGGAIVSLYIDDQSAEDIRPTKDLDLTIEIASLSALESLRLELIGLGFKQTPSEPVICRFRYEDVNVDVMSTVSIGWAPGNRWFEHGFSLAFSYSIDNQVIKLLPLPYFLASKFDAFFSRGISDIWASHDYEDIVYLLNHVSDLAQQVEKSDAMVKNYLKGCSIKILESSQLRDAVVGQLFHEAQDERFQLILSKLNVMARF